VEDFPCPPSENDGSTFYLRKTEFMLAFPSRGIRPGGGKIDRAAAEAKGEEFLFESAVTH
jgi:hypothetical protein